MRIAYFVDCFPRISETFVLAQITGMMDRGHDVKIFTNQLVQADVQHHFVEQYQLYEKTVVIPWVPRKPVKRLIPAIRGMVDAVRRRSFIPALRALNVLKFGRKALGLSLFIQATGKFEPVNFDIIHCQFGQLGIMVAELRQCSAISGSLVTSFRGTDAMKYASRQPELFSRLFSSGDEFLAVSDAVRRQLIAIGCPANRTHLLRSGIDLDRFSARKSRQLDSPVRLISVGRLAANKGIEYALHAVQMLRNAGIETRYRIFGTGPCEAELVRKAAQLEIESAVTFEGAVSSSCVIEALNDADILVAPSITGPDGEQEGLPNSLKEAMAVGVIAIGTTTGGIPELISDGVSGFLVEEKDAAALAACISSTIDGGENLNQIVAAARRKVESEYDINRLNDELEGTYLGLMKKR
jgi:colanic acid/amylovoran biosynthesis glycosyltransferase